MPRAEICVLHDRATLEREAVVEIVRRGAEAIADRGVFRLALAGGDTPRAVYRALAAKPDALSWAETELFWGDEREVPPDHAESNYGAVSKDLLQRLPQPPRAVYRIEAEHGAATAAWRYEATLRRAFRLVPGELPRFDLVLLGMGNDGHTASLFPGSDALAEQKRWVAAPWIAALGAHRITLTYPVLNAARAVLFLVAGEAKAATLARVLEGPHDTTALPAQGISPTEGELLWWVDRAAAALLKGPSASAPSSLCPAPRS